MFFLILVEEELEQLEKFNALKASKPVAAEIVDHMEFEAAPEEEAVF
jgi:hypothetical protein